MLMVGNTGDDGMYLRRSPTTGERIKGWPVGARMVVVERAGVVRIEELVSWGSVTIANS